MKYLCGVCGSTSHPTEEHVNQIEGEIESKNQAPLANALDIISRLDRRPSSQETIDIVDQPVEEWLKKSKDTWLKKTIAEEAAIHRASGLDELYSQAILKSMHSNLRIDHDFKRKKGESNIEFIKRSNRRPEHEYYGYTRIWAKNLSRSEAETIYTNAVKDAHQLLAELQAIDLVDNPVLDKRLLRLLYRRENLHGIIEILLDWQYMSEMDLDEFHHGDSNLREVLDKIDDLGNRIMQRVERPQSFQDERLRRTVLNDTWHELEGDWWTIPGVWEVEELEKKFRQKI